jgi:hypothetical protein
MEYIAKNIKLVWRNSLDLSKNQISDKWAEYIIKNVDLKKITGLNMAGNNISEEMQTKLYNRQISQRPCWHINFIG